MKTKRNHFFRFVLFSILFALVLSLCACSATSGNIFGGHKVDERIDISKIKAPETVYAYEGKSTFGKLDMNTLISLFFGDATTELAKSDRYVRITAQDKSYLHINLSKPGELSQENAGTMTYFSVRIKKDSGFMGKFALDIYKKAQGNFGSVLGEPAETDPAMISAKNHSGKIMDELEYSNYELLRANKFSADDVKEIARMLVITDTKGEFTGKDLPTVDLYYIEYQIYPEAVAEGHTNDWMICRFIYDKDGLIMAFIEPEPRPEITASGTPISAKEAYQIALNTFDGSDKLVLFDVQFMLSDYNEDFRPVWVFAFAQEKENLSEDYKKRVKSCGGKGWYDMQIRCVDALSGTFMKQLAWKQPMRTGSNPLINKYNNPKLFK